jgi:metal-responsive CopG/Arc/MetJ family transcriptional regulator
MRGQQHYYSDDEEEFVALPTDVLEQIDEQLGVQYKNRTDFIRAATHAYIADKSKNMHSPLSRFRHAVN